MPELIGNKAGKDVITPEAKQHTLLKKRAQGKLDFQATECLLFAGRSSLIAFMSRGVSLFFSRSFQKVRDLQNIIQSSLRGLL